MIIYVHNLQPNKAILKTTTTDNINIAVFIKSHMLDAGAISNSKSNVENYIDSFKSAIISCRNISSG